MSGLPEIDGVIDLTEIGRGGFGVVYRGVETEFHRDVAVKVLMPSLDERTQRRFERERGAMGSVSNHPNIVTVYRGGVTPNHQPYLVMEYLPGGSLSDRLHQVGPLDWRAAGRIGATLADALSAAHRGGILHRDVKPGNVFMTSSGEPKLGDFGIARLDDGQDSRSGSITASIAHAAPEIVDGQRGDERSDLYSLASTIYALTIGTAPFSRDPDQGLAKLLSRISREDPPHLHLESEASEFEAVLMTALSKAPADRQTTVAEFGRQLRSAVAAPVRSAPIRPSGIAGIESAATSVDVEPPSVDRSAGSPRRTSPGQIAGVVLLALAIAGFGGWAVARAVFSGNDSDVTTLASPTAQPNATDAAVAEPTTEPEPAATTESATTAPAPTSEPTAAPEATEVEAQPTVVGGGSRGSNLGGRTIVPAATEGYSTVTDPSGAISIDVPNEWTERVQNGDSAQFDDLDFSFRGLAVGGTFADLGGDPEFRDLTRSGISVFAARLDAEATSVGDLLDVGLEQWPDCEIGDRSQIPLEDGDAEYQIMACARDDGENTGVVVLGMIPGDDNNVTVSVNVQFAEFDDLGSLPTVLGSLRIDASQVPSFDS